MTTPTQTLLATYAILGLPLAWLYMTDISPQKTTSKNPGMHFAGTFLLIIATIFWIIVVPGWILDKQVVKNNQS